MKEGMHISNLSSNGDSAGEGATRKLQGGLSFLSAWAISFGCVVGWGAFVMPSQAFLHVAGPLGTVLGILIGAVVMLAIAFNYSFLMKRIPDAGGAYAYVRTICNYDHGYLCAWFLILTYIAIFWANATAIPLIGRNLLGGVFCFGFHYSVAGFEVYMGEILVSMLAMVAVHALLAWRKGYAAWLQTLLALLLAGGIMVAAVAVFCHSCSDGVAKAVSGMAPAFSDTRRPLLQIASVVGLMPWAFVGFESVSYGAEESRFNVRRVIWIFLASILAGALAYAFLAFVAAMVRPEGFADWPSYIAASSSLDGLKGLPVFYAIDKAMGRPGYWLLCVLTLCAVVTGMIGHLAIASRVLFSISRDALLPKWFSGVNADYNPVRAQTAILLLSLVVPFVGRTAVGWIVDVTTIGASIAYGYVSYCAYSVAQKENRRSMVYCGAFGIIASAAFICYSLVPSFWTISMFSAESYLILAGWSILGVFIFRKIFSQDEKGRLGKSTIVWIALIFLIFFTSHMWLRQAAGKVTDSAIMEVCARCSRGDEPSGEVGFLQSRQQGVKDALVRYNLAQMLLVVLALGVMYNIYSTISRRERESAKAKGYFFSTVSHDIRTPLNAIVGFSQMLKMGCKTKEEEREAVDSILASGNTLLRLISDILELSKLDTGKVVIVREPTDCGRLFREVVETFRFSAEQHNLLIQYKADPLPALEVDSHRLRQVVFNLVGNAVKFTDKGHVEVRAAFRNVVANVGDLVVEIEDTGPGISEEDLKHIAMPYVQLCTKLARHGGTGLGLAICKQLAKAMDGELMVGSELGKGSTFVLTLHRVKAVPSAELPVASAIPQEPASAPEPPAPAPESPVTASQGGGAHQETETPNQDAANAKNKPKVLLVDDSKMNLMVLKALLKKVGDFDIVTAMDGSEAFKLLRGPEGGSIDMVLTDMWMPQMDGEGLAKAIRADPLLSPMPVYVITADVELVSNYKEKGFDGIHLKPVTLEQLKETCSCITTSRRTEGAT